MAGEKGVEVKNFTTSFKDGLAFCAIVDSHKPGSLGVPYESLSADDAERNLQLAFDAAHKMGVPKLLDAEDIVDMPVPDKFSMITYLSEMYKAFSGLERGWAGSGRSSPSSSKTSTPRSTPRLPPKNAGVGGGGGGGSALKSDGDGNDPDPPRPDDGKKRVLLRLKDEDKDDDDYVGPTWVEIETDKLDDLVELAYKTFNGAMIQGVRRADNNELVTDDGVRDGDSYVCEQLA